MYFSKLFNANENEWSKNTVTYYWYDYLIFVILGVGILTNLLNIFVFSHAHFRQTTNYKLLLSKSIASLVFLVLILVAMLCGSISATHSSWFSPLLIIAIRFYFDPCLQTYLILVNLSLTFRAYARLANRKIITSNNNNNSELSPFFWTNFKFIVFSLLFFLPLPFGFKILHDEYNTYSIDISGWGTTMSFAALGVAYGLFIIILSLVVLTTFVVIAYVAHRKRYPFNSNSPMNMSINHETNTIRTSGGTPSTINQQPIRVGQIDEFKCQSLMIICSTTVKIGFYILLAVFIILSVVLQNSDWYYLASASALAPLALDFFVYLSTNQNFCRVATIMRRNYLLESHTTLD